ncbi:major facilitator superfamily domain-containing protein [Aspergillus cavernicola]|uniref:Major facilitator superfamily domain-containing protein n=1 Tax=Aspergillus cavernicola TaxID=176166 RepID=A0ABR4IP49_9EURO
MIDIFRETAAGQIVRFLSQGKFLQYPEELPGFRFQYPELNRSPLGSENSTLGPSHASDPERAQTKIDVSQLAIDSMTTGDNKFVLVDWYTADDPANPQNWSTSKKALVAFEICIYTFTVYIGGAIYAPSTAGVMEDFDCAEIVASLGLALYVLGYGLGALLWSPLSEIPMLGRTGIYVATFSLFTILLIPTALVQNLAGLLILRFLLGWFGSPSLATGAAGFSDMFGFLKLPYCLAFWACSGTMAPAIGPIVAGFSVPAKDWHWSQWELLWLSGPILILLFTLLPETSSDTILLRRVRRLRKITGDANLRSQSEIKMQHMTAKEMAFNTLVKPWEMNALDPAILFTTVYCSLCYAIFYSFFEVFPFVFSDMYHFSLGESGLAFLSVSVGVLITVPLGLLHYNLRVEPRLVKEGFPAPEVWLRPGLIGSFLVPLGLFIFAWTARPSVHWIVPLVGVVVNQSGCYLILNVLFTYLPNIYPKYAASLFAANNAARSTLATASIVFGRPMFLALGVAGGVSFLAGVSCLCTVAFYGLYFYGPSLRSRSRFVST